MLTTNLLCLCFFNDVFKLASTFHSVLFTFISVLQFSYPRNLNASDIEHGEGVGGKEIPA